MAVEGRRFFRLIESEKDCTEDCLFGSGWRPEWTLMMKAKPTVEKGLGGSGAPQTVSSSVLDRQRMFRRNLASDGECPHSWSGNRSSGLVAVMRFGSRLTRARKKRGSYMDVGVKAMIPRIGAPSSRAVLLELIFTSFSSTGSPNFDFTQPTYNEPFLRRPLKCLMYILSC